MTTLLFPTPTFADADELLPVHSRTNPIRNVNPDQQLLDQLVAREHEALGVAYDRYGKPLFSLCHKMLGNQRECEEVIQDVFLALWKNAATLDLSRSKLFTWLVAIMRNRSIDRLRARQRRIPAATEAQQEPNESKEPASERTALHALFQKERAEELRTAVDTLPSEQQRAIEMAFFWGMTHQEIAENLGESLGTIKSRIRYGLQKLRGLVNEEVAHG